jgi:2-dehydro-3-deoxyphosphogluconate aldolase/(4S)-4-hydroxy-2-oxoglutarate aldolase
MALEKELSVVKFFPAEPMGGLPFLKAMAAPYGMMSFIPTGGISSKTSRTTSAQPVVACGGSWMAPAEWIKKQMFDRIRDETKNAVEAAR